jgi:DNA-binding XRE family transcriptional regulator
MIVEYIGADMDIQITTPEEFGKVVREARKHRAHLRQVEAAQIIGVSHTVLNKLEQGKEVWLSKAIELCNGVGIEIILRIPDEVA